MAYAWLSPHLTWWRSLKKLVVYSTLDIYSFIINNIDKFLLLLFFLQHKLLIYTKKPKSVVERDNNNFTMSC